MSFSNPCTRLLVFFSNNDLIIVVLLLERKSSSYHLYDHVLAKYILCKWGTVSIYVPLIWFNKHIFQEYLARPKTPATGRPKTASSVQQQNSNVTTESSKPIISFDEFNKQFSKVKFDNCGYVVHPYSCPWEIAQFGVQGKQVQLSDSKFWHQIQRCSF